jgi:hypothetical protein
MAGAAMHPAPAYLLVTGSVAVGTAGVAAEAEKAATPSDRPEA